MASVDSGRPLVPPRAAGDAHGVECQRSHRGGSSRFAERGHRSREVTEVSADFSRSRAEAQFSSSRSAASEGDPGSAEYITTAKPGSADTPPQIIVAAGPFAVDQGVALTRAGETGFAVLTKLVEQGPGFEIYDYAAVN